MYFDRVAVAYGSYNLSGHRCFLFLKKKKKQQPVKNLSLYSSR